MLGFLGRSRAAGAGLRGSRPVLRGAAAPGQWGCAHWRPGAGRGRQPAGAPQHPYQPHGEITSFLGGVAALAETPPLKA